MDIRGAWHVAGRVAEHLDVRGQASDVAVSDEAAPAEAGGREHPVVAVRHPVNGYRLFKRDDLDALLNQVAQVTGKSSRD